MSTHSSIPEEPCTPLKEELEVAYPPRHPVPCMQAAFEESMYEQGHQPLSNNPFAIMSGDGEEAVSPTFIPRYHPLTKLISQITFGIHLLHKRLAKSDSEVVRILQSHVNDMDNFLSTTTHDFDLAKSDISARIKNLQVPLENGHASDVFESMLRDPVFRTQIMEGNKKVEYVIKRTARAMNRALEDVGQGLRAVDELAKYLLTLKTGWKNANLVRVYGAMTHNVEGWFRCFVGLQMKGQVLGEKLNQLKLIVWEIERRCGRVSRRESMGGRNSSAVVKKRQSLNLIPEIPSHESQEARPTLHIVSDKSLPTTPIPTPVTIKPEHAIWPKHSESDSRDNGLLKRSLSKRRSVSGPLPIRTTSLPKPNAEAVGPGSETRKLFELASAPDEKEKEKKLKKKHRRSQSSASTTCAEAQDSNGNMSKPASLAVSLRRSLSLGRSSKKEKEKERKEDQEGDQDKRDRPLEPAGLVPPVPPLPVQSQGENKAIMEASSEEKSVPQGSEVEEPKALPVADSPPESAAAAEEIMSDTQTAMPVKRKKSRAHLHHPSGQFAALQKRKSACSVSSVSADSTVDALASPLSEKEAVPPTPPVPSTPPTPLDVTSLPNSQNHSRPRAQTSAPKAHSRRHSVISSAGGNVLNSILGLRPKSRQGNASGAAHKVQTKEKVPPVPPLPAQTPPSKTTALVPKLRTGSVLQKQKVSGSQPASALISSSSILRSVKELQDPKNGKSSTGLDSRFAQAKTGRTNGPAFRLGGLEEKSAQTSQEQPTLITDIKAKDVKLPRIISPSKDKSGLIMSGLTNMSNGNLKSPPNSGTGKADGALGSRIARSGTIGASSVTAPSPKSPSRGFLFKFFNDRSF